MNKEGYKIITEAVEKTLFEKEFKKANDEGIEYYSNGERAFTVEYNSATSQLELKTAYLKEGAGVDWKVVSSWLLDDSSNERDKKSVANDFSDSITEQLGIKTTVNVDMPKKADESSVIDIENFTARFLSIFPAYKEAYVQNAAEYGEFMYDKFFGEYAVVELQKALKDDNKKLATNIFKLLSKSYINGDSKVGAVVVYTIMAGALLDSTVLREKADFYLDKHIYLKKAVVNMLAMLDNQSKRKKYLA